VAAGLCCGPGWFGGGDGFHTREQLVVSLVKAQLLGFAHSDVERALLDNHERRRRNPGLADWRLTAGRLVIVYHYPDRGDASTACIVTLWRRK
jgi:hypothetical protein